jgi:hypothetical protein
MTGAAIARVLGHASVSVNYRFCEWMSEMFYDNNHLPDLMIRRPDLHPKEQLITDYLGGVCFVDEGTGYEECLTYYPESQEKCFERNIRLIDGLIQWYQASNKEERRVLHIVVTHGYHVESIGILHGG